MPGRHDSIAWRDENEPVLMACQRDAYAGVAPSYRQKQNRSDGISDPLDASWNLQFAACLGGQPIRASSTNCRKACRGQLPKRKE